MFNVSNFLSPDEAKHVHAAIDQQDYEARYGSPAVRRLFFAELARAINDDLASKGLLRKDNNGQNE